MALLNIGCVEKGSIEAVTESILAIIGSTASEKVKRDALTTLRSLVKPTDHQISLTGCSFTSECGEEKIGEES